MSTAIFTFLLTVFTQTVALLYNSSYHSSKSNPTLSRVYKGYPVSIDQYSYATFLLFENTMPSSCGGSLIMVQAVLTAAHCVDELRNKNGTIFAYFGSEVPKNAKIIKKVDYYEIHPKYDEVKGRSNMAVVFLDERVPLMHLIKKIPLAIVDVPPQTEVFSVGWGKQVFNKLPDISRFRPLRCTKQRIVTREECFKYAGYKVSSNGICSMPLIGHHYKDDSGDGLVVKKPMLLLVGVLSYVTGGVSVYSSVIANREWIIKACQRLYAKTCHKRKNSSNNPHL